MMVDMAWLEQEIQELASNHTKETPTTVTTTSTSNSTGKTKNLYLFILKN